MMPLLTTFAALSMAGTVLLSLLPEGGMKRTASLAVGLLTLLCWAEGVAGLLEIDLAAELPSTALTATALTLEDASADAVAALQEASP